MAGLLEERVQRIERKVERLKDEHALVDVEVSVELSDGRCTVSGRSPPAGPRLRRHDPNGLSSGPPLSAGTGGAGTIENVYEPYLLQFDLQARRAGG